MLQKKVYTYKKNEPTTPKTQIQTLLVHIFREHLSDVIVGYFVFCSLSI